ALAPEHVELILQTADDVALRLTHFGALFIGASSAEVLGDYGAGPNHVLPTAGSARSRGGLSVYTFLRVRTWLRIDDASAARPLSEHRWLSVAAYCSLSSSFPQSSRHSVRRNRPCTGGIGSPSRANRSARKRAR